MNKYCYKNQCLYYLFNSKRGNTEVLVFPFGVKYSNFQVMFMDCVIYKIDSEDNFNAFNHIDVINQGTSFSQVGYFLKAHVINEISGLLQNNLFIDA
jgi:hypothetical protein